MTNRSVNNKLTNLCVTLLVLSQYLTMILGCYFTDRSGYFTMVMVVVLILFVVNFFFSPIRMVSRKFILYAALILLAYMLTVIFCEEETNLTAIDFLVFCLIPFIFGGILKFNCRTVLRWSMYAVLLAFPVFSEVFAKGNEGLSYDAVSMGSSYALLPVVGAALVHFMLFRKESTFLDKIVYGLNLIFLTSFIQMSYRGSLLCVAVIFVACLWYNITKEGINRKKLFAMMFFSLTLMFMFIFSDAILNSVLNFLDANNIRIAFIDKNMYLASVGDGGLAHGRFEIWGEAWNGFLESPVYGHGLTTFLYHTGITFPHNFVLQFLYDGGLILALPLFYLIIKGIKNGIKERNTNKDQMAFIIFAGGIAFTRGLVSAETWRIILLWLIMGYFSRNMTYTARTTDVVIENQIN